MTKVDDPMPNVALDAIQKHDMAFPEASESNRDRLTGIDWLRRRLSDGRYGMCSEHYHAECLNCGDSTKCVGSSGYDQYESVKQVCDCEREPTKHIVVPFDNFGQYVGFPK